MLIPIALQENRFVFYMMSTLTLLVLKLVIVLNNFLIAYRAMPFFRQLINRKECTTVQQHLRTIFFTNTFSNCEYFATGNIVSDVADHFSQFCIFQSSIETTQPVKISIQNYAKSLSRGSCRIFLNFNGNLFFLGAMSISYSLLLITS